MSDHVCVRTGVSYECSCGWHLDGNTDVFKCNALIAHIADAPHGGCICSPVSACGNAGKNETPICQRDMKLPPLRLEAWTIFVEGI